MKKIPLILTTLILTILPATPAFANPGTVTPVAHTLRPCVATEWSVQHTHQPMTRPGEACTWRMDIPWVPESWTLVRCASAETYVVCVLRRPNVVTPKPTFQGYPLCISTSWAQHHYKVPMTAKGATCIVRMHRVPNTPGTQVFGGATVASYEPSWFPPAWQVTGIVSTPDGSPVGMLVRRPK